MTIELTDEMREAYADARATMNHEQAQGRAPLSSRERNDDGLRAVLAIVEHDASKAEREAYADGYRRGCDGYLPDRPLYVPGDRADHAWQEYNEHGNSCHFPTCIFTRDEHAS